MTDLVHETEGLLSLSIIKASHIKLFKKNCKNLKTSRTNQSIASSIDV